MTPEKGDEYFVPFMFIGSGHYIYLWKEQEKYTRHTWTDSVVDNSYYNTGFVCKTPEDAVELCHTLVEAAKQQREKD